MRSPLVRPFSGKNTLSRFVSVTSRRPIRTAARLVKSPLLGTPLYCPWAHDGGAGSPHTPGVWRMPVSAQRLHAHRGGLRPLRITRAREGAPRAGCYHGCSHGEVAEWLKA